MTSRICAATVLVALVAPAWLCAAERDRLSVLEDDKALTVRAGGKTVLRYNIAPVGSPEKEKPYYARSGHIHPVYTPQGNVVTGDMCPDHAHQHAVWFAWTNAEFEGRKIDFWNSQARQGRVEHVKVIGKEHGDGEARFRVKLRHLDITGQTPKEVLYETWDVRVQAVEDVYVIDLESTQQCAADSPLKLKEYHYGAMGLRNPMAWNAPDGGFLTSEGKTRADGNHTRPDWVDSFGPVKGDDAKQKTAGITVMQHPSNFRYPQPVRLHPKLSYFCFAPMVLGDFTIEPGEVYVSRFRYVVHDGPIDKELTEKLWREFTVPLLEFNQPSGAVKRSDDALFRVGIAADGKLSLDGEQVTTEEMSERVKSRLAELKETDRPPKRAAVEIDAAYDTPYEHVIAVISVLGNAGVKGIRFRSPKQE